MSPRLEVGRIDKPHGVQGEVIVSLITDRTERVAVGSRLQLENGRELVVHESRPHQARWIVQFDGLYDRNGADSVHGAALYAEPIEDENELWVHELIGSTVVDVADGRELGVVASVEANPASDLLVLGDGGLIPMRFVVDSTDGRVTVDIPEGLLDT